MVICAYAAVAEVSHFAEQPPAGSPAAFLDVVRLSSSPFLSPLVYVIMNTVVDDGYMSPPYLGAPTASASCTPVHHTVTHGKLTSELRLRSGRAPLL